MIIIKVWLIVFLLICAITDLTQRYVYTMFCIANGLIIGMMQFFIKGIDIKNCIGGVLIGAILFIVCLFAKNSIGRGDALIIAIVGLALGFNDTLEVLFWSFFVIVVISIFGICKRKITLKTKIPFIPFVWLGTVITMIISGG